MTDPKQSKHLSILNAALRRENFDPRNVEHMTIARKFLKEGRQDPVVRFNVEAPYLDVRSLLLSRIAEAYTADFFKVNKATKRPVPKKGSSVLPLKKATAEA